MTPLWLRRRERGSRFLIRILARTTLVLGRSVSRWSLYPICLYFLLFSGGTRQNSHRFLTVALGRNATWKEVFRHYHAFATTIHDRVYLLSGRHRHFEIRIEGVEIVQRYLDRKQGCVLLGSHHGSFEVLRAQGLLDKDVSLSIIMHEDGAANLNAVLHALHPEVREKIIAPGRPDTLLRVKDCLDRGELVGVLGDRVFTGERTVMCRFLGQPTLFPEGPLLMAGLLKAPVVLFFGLYVEDRRYEIRFEAFADHIELSRAGYSEAIRPWVERYADRLEHYCRAYPFNWFNFYGLSHDHGPGGNGISVDRGGR